MILDFFSDINNNTCSTTGTIGTVFTVCIRTDRLEQTVNPDQMLQNTFAIIQRVEVHDQVVK